MDCPDDCGHWACGDGDCDPGENPVDCPEDCQPFACGNHTCDPTEDVNKCPADCGTACGDCLCIFPESFDTCPVDCGYCGDGYCVEKCAYLIPENKNTCPADCCLPDCFGKECGDDGCAGLCGLCPGDDLCRNTCLGGTCGPGFDEEARCDGSDEDCDGLTDEDFAWEDPESGEARGLGEACGQDACAGGVLVCSANGEGLTCSTEAAGSERCDGLDNDCDGLTDVEDAEDLALGDPQPCEVQFGVCAGSTKPASLCVGGEWLACGVGTYLNHAADYEAGQEARCDGLDNDCDGEIDEDFTRVLLTGETVAGPGVACGVGMCPAFSTVLPMTAQRSASKVR